MNAVTIIGAGAAGLFCAYKLSKHKIPVTVLEAKARLGGRMHTITGDTFSQHIEAGAEFIHGNLPITLALLNEAGIKYHVINDAMFQLDKGKFKKRNGFGKHWNKLMKYMGNIEHDIPLADFLDKYFAGDKYNELRESVKNFAGGFDLADISTASTKSLYSEWNEEIEEQYRIDGGYKKLVDYLEAKCKQNGCIIQTNCCVKKISWQQNEADIFTMCSRLFKGNKIIITVPLSVLQAGNENENYIEFAPAIPQHINAAKEIGFGPVIKIILEFNENFWNKNSINASMFFINETVPTWWTQLPVENNILTGWVGGAKASSLKDNTDEKILQVALQSLVSAFAMPLQLIQSKLKAAKIANWCKEQHINGGYSFNKIKSAEARKILQKPVNNTIFFCGEALYEGTHGGTVEAALSNAEQTAAEVLKMIKQ